VKHKEAVKMNEQMKNELKKMFADEIKEEYHR